MLYYAALTCLAPLLAVQGHRVRKNTPRLSEASGERSGTTGDGAKIRVLILGDSAAAGVGVEHQHDALSGCLTRSLAKQCQVTWLLLAKSGNKTSDLIRLVKAQPKTDYDAVLLSIGVNDLLSPITEYEWQRQQQELLSLIKAQFQSPHILLTSVPPMEHFPAFPQPLRWCLGQRSAAFNRRLKQLISTETQCSLIQIPLEPKPTDMAIDGFHPGANIYMLWGSHAANEIVKSVKLG
ncbi:SGNH/GDSL hydrolase family protein [Shewanella sp. UCD-KL12]|uniref:SGNH/GDSL hydrolase family protein n=1 Tax=Shewanella sp. UCD-KL12 TaxID=1917163 RepID=UPI0009704A5F|nr:SGNH/GDSL hydrolase family protein [Shewanella sp. UCD-KL12]